MYFVQINESNALLSEFIFITNVANPVGIGVSVITMVAGLRTDDKGYSETDIILVSELHGFVTQGKSCYCTGEEYNIIYS